VTRRRLAVLVVAVVAAAALAADSPGAGRPPVAVPTDATPATIIGDTLYTSPADGGRFSAYSLRTGERRWTADVPALAHVTVAAIGSSTVLVSSWDQEQTFAVDARTGAMRWRRPGSAAWWSKAADRIALISQNPADDGPNHDRYAVTMVSAATGDGGTELDRTGPISPVYNVDDEGTPMIGLFVRDDAEGGRLFEFATGRSRRLGLPQPPPPAEPGTTDLPQYEGMVVAGDRLLVASSWGEQLELAGYTGDPPRRLWTASDQIGLPAQRCGANLCGSDGTQMFAIDPANGETRWRGGFGMGWPAAGNHVLTSRVSDGIGAPGVTILDGANGRELLGHNTWRLVPATTANPVRVPILVYEAGQQLLASLDLVRLTTRRIAVLPNPGLRCWAGETFVACRIDRDHLRVWRYSS
jgi:PQQ-like domain